jgi:hypothetical protein
MSDIKSGDAIVKFDSSQKIVLLDPSVLKEAYERLKSVKSIKTPASQVKMKGDFPYAEYSYMLDQFEQQHPLYAFKIEPSGTFFSEKYIIYHVAVHLVDLATGESRAGVGSHPVLAYEAAAKGGAMKDIAWIRQQMSNAYKSALTEAQRNAMSNWGICADMYGTQTNEPPTQEQKQKMDNATELVNLYNVSTYSVWWVSIIEGFKTQTKESFDSWYEKLIPTLNLIEQKLTAREKQNGNETR